VLRISAPRETTGRYAFALWSAPVQDFRIRVGSFVGPGEPAAGAGRLEAPGSVDRYSFAAEADTRIVVDPRPVAGWCGHGQVLRWSLFSELMRAAVVSHQLLYSFGSCFHADPVRLPVGGRYALVVHGQWPQWDRGSYRFVVVPLAR
jgi:hypothetical protein